jgi:hypothetical protein
LQEVLHWQSPTESQPKFFVEPGLLTPKPFLKTGRSVHALPSLTEPLGPAPPIKAKEMMVLKMNRNTLTNDPKY